MLLSVDLHRIAPVRAYVFLAADHRGALPEFDEGGDALVFDALSQLLIDCAALCTFSGVLDARIRTNENEGIPCLRMLAGME